MALTFVTAGGMEQPGVFAVTQSVNVGTGVHKILIVNATVTHAAAIPVPASCSYAGVTLTPFPGGNIDGWGITWKTQFFYMLDPPNGANNLVITADWDGAKICVNWAVWSAAEALTVANLAAGNNSGATQVSSVTSAAGQTVVGMHIQAGDSGSDYVPDSPTVERSDIFTDSSLRHQSGDRPGATPSAGLSWTGFNAPFVYGVISLSEAAAGLTKKWAIPTNVADGTERRLYIYNPTTFATVIDNQLVTASGGFFKYADATLTVGQKRPVGLMGFGADETADARGGAAWATGIEE